MTATEHNYQLYSVLNSAQREAFFPFVIGFMGDALDPEVFAQAFVSFCQEPCYNPLRARS